MWPEAAAAAAVTAAAESKAAATATGTTQMVAPAAHTYAECVCRGGGEQEK